MESSSLPLDVSSPESLGESSFDSSSEEVVESKSSEEKSEQESSAQSHASSEEPPAIDGLLAQQLVVNAPRVDQALHAKSANIHIEADGYDGGIRYHQESTSVENSYEGDLTIASGSISHESGGTEFSDTFDEVRTIKSNLYIRLREYKEKVFEDESEQHNLLSDISDIERAHYLVSCGAGYKAFSDFYQAASMDATFTYSYEYGDKGEAIIEFSAYGEYTTSNQAYVATFTYIFDNVDTGRLLSYTSDQSYYSLDRYLKDDSIEPTYHAIEITDVNFGNLEGFSGVLPVDLDAGFVSRIVLSAAKTSIEVDETIALKAEVFPNTAVDQSLRFSSDNTSVALVDNDGRVKGVGEGKATITALNIASGVTGSIEITVTKKSEIDTGDDSLKGDLKEAIEKSWNQVFKSEDLSWDKDSVTGMLIDDEAKLKSGYFSTLSVSKFLYNPNTRTASYAGSDLQTVALSILPFLDNGNDNLTNDYGEVSWSYVYHEVVSSMEIVLSSSNTISYIHFHGRTDSVEEPDGFDFASETNETIKRLSFEANPYEKDMYYVSKGFISYDD